MVVQTDDGVGASLCGNLIAVIVACYLSAGTIITLVTSNSVLGAF
ncbi:hypothetical protein VB618_00970 [Microvirga sp. CF3062]|nr:hypothetical protein [Microvirga sp. CF3062]MEE1654751.1 hypothetical protein [Microvirga sp. CF3062]